jgi:hypothetical protein
LRPVAELRAVLLTRGASRPPAPLDTLPTIPLDAAKTQESSSSGPAAGFARELGFILSFSAERCPIELIDAPTHGVWEFRWGAHAFERGSPSGFWEVYERSPLTVARLVRLAPEAGAIVLRAGHFRTHSLSVPRNRAQLATRTARWPAQVCTDIHTGIVGPLTAGERISEAPSRRRPSSLQRFRCRLTIGAGVIGKILDSLLRHDQWNVGCVSRPIQAFLSTPLAAADVDWLPPSNRAEFKADPFGVRRDGRLVILYEHFSYATNLGIIAAIEPDGTARGRAGARDEAAAHGTPGARGVPVKVGPEPAVHLSYPYLFELDGRLLCIPESHQAAEVGLYEVERFPDRFRKVADLLEGIEVVDATLFRHQELWWLAGSEPTAQGTTCELSLWYAERIEGPWRPHAGNPVKMDVRSARPGGTPFHHEGALYRPAQDCSATYGGRLIINRVVTLTPTAFHEVPAAIISPDPTGPYPSGLHTLSQVGDMTLIDAKRFIFSPTEFRRVLMHYLRSAFRSLSRST